MILLEYNLLEPIFYISIFVIITVIIYMMRYFLKKPNFGKENDAGQKKVKGATFLEIRNNIEEISNETFEIRGLQAKALPNHRNQEWLRSELEQYFPNDPLIHLAESSGVEGFIEDKRLLLGFVLVFIAITKVDDLVENEQLDRREIDSLLIMVLENKSTSIGNDSNIFKSFKEGIDILSEYYGERFHKCLDSLKIYLSCIAKRELHSKFTTDYTINNQFSMDEFWTIRRKDFCSDFVISLMALHFNLDKVDQATAMIVEMFFKCYITCMILINELYSWKKEVQEKTYSCNYLFLKYVREENLCLQEIADQVVLECQIEILKCQDYGNQLINLDPNLEYFVECMLTMINNVNYIHTTSPRYNQSILTYNLVFNRIKLKNTLDMIINKIISDKNDPALLEIYDRIRDIYEYNIGDGKLMRAEMVFRAYHMIASGLGKKLNEQDTLESYIMACTIEIIHAFALIIDDIIDESETRRNKPCWYKKTGQVAINDALILEQQCYLILRMFFAQKSYYTKVFDALKQVSLLTTYGQSLDIKTSQTNTREDRFKYFTSSRLQTIYKYKTSYYTFVFPFKIVMIAHGCDTEDELSLMEPILVKIGHLYQMQDDYIDCYGEPTITGKIGTDIAEGKCCWLIVTALGLCDERQLNALKNNYGIKSEINVKAVKEIYKELDLFNLYKRETKELYHNICADIQIMKDKSNLCPELYDYILSMIYKRIK